MKNLTTILCLTITLLLGSIGDTESAEFQKGLAAANSGDFTTAMREWTPLAEQRNADAQSILGTMYNEGKGVLQNYKTAVKCCRLAVKQGDPSALEGYLASNVDLERSVPDIISLSKMGK